MRDQANSNARSSKNTEILRDVHFAGTTSNPYVCLCLQPVGGLPSRPEALDADEKSGGMFIIQHSNWTEPLKASKYFLNFHIIRQLSSIYV